MRWRTGWGLLVAVALVGCDARAAAPQALEIDFLDVGQGDAVLLRSEGKAALVDAGPSDGVLEQIRALGVERLDLLVASHNHSDHIGGADAVLARLPVRFYLDNGRPANTRIQKRVLDLVEEKGVAYLRASPRTIALGSARLTIIPSPLAGRVDEQNDQSVVVLVEQGRFRALLAGDAEVAEINALLDSVRIPDVDVLKADHHGSRNGVTPAWLSRTRPEVVVISAGRGNVYGHPHARALRLYDTGGRRIYRTDLDGTVTVRVDSAGGYTVRTARQDAAPATRDSARSGPRPARQRERAPARRPSPRAPSTPERPR